MRCDFHLLSCPSEGFFFCCSSYQDCMSSTTYINSNGRARTSMNALIKRHANASALALQSGSPKSQIEMLLAQVPNYARAVEHVFAMRPSTSPRRRSSTSPRRRSSTSPQRRSSTSPQRRSSTSPRRRSSTSPQRRSSTSPRRRSSTSPQRRSSTSSQSRSPTNETLANRINRVVGSKPRLYDGNYEMNSSEIRTMLKDKINNRAFSDLLAAMNNRELSMAADAMRGDSRQNKMKALATLSGQPFTNMLERHLYRNGGLLRPHRRSL